MMVAMGVAQDRNHIKASLRDIIVVLHDKDIETRDIWGLINE